MVLSQEASDVCFRGLSWYKKKLHKFRAQYSSLLQSYPEGNFIEFRLVHPDHPMPKEQTSLYTCTIYSTESDECL